MDEFYQTFKGNFISILLKLLQKKWRERNTSLFIFRGQLTLILKSDKDNIKKANYREYMYTAKSLQSCPTLCDPTDGSPPGYPVPGILQARTLEWVAISFSNAWKWKVKVKSLSRVQPSATPWTAAFQTPPSMGFFQARVLEWGAIAFSNMYTYGWLMLIYGRNQHNILKQLPSN